MSKLLIIVGPTATGKTKLGVDLCKKYSGEIISADSRQVYRGMDIVTGKDKADYGDIPVWGIDLVDPDYSFNVSDFVQFATEKIAELENRGKLPIIVGGTILYVKALLEPFETINVPRNEKLRAELDKLSVSALQERLGANNLNASDAQNPRRLVRAIEVNEGNRVPPPRHNYDYKIISLTAPLEDIYRKVDSRVDERIQTGAKEEYSLLLKKYPPSLPSFTSLGYKAIDNPDLWKQREHQYAKRQITFLKKFLQDKEVIELTINGQARNYSQSLRERQEEIATFLSKW